MRKQTTVRDLQEDRDRNWGYVYDRVKGKRVVIEWDINPQAKAERVFKMVVDGKEVFLQVDEVQKMLRWV